MPRDGKQCLKKSHTGKSTSEARMQEEKQLIRQSVLEVFRARMDVDGHNGAILVNNNLVFKNAARKSSNQAHCVPQEITVESSKKKQKKTRSELDQLHLKLLKRRDKNKENLAPSHASEFKKHAKKLEKLSHSRCDALSDGVAGLIASHRLTQNVGLFNKGKKSATLSRALVPVENAKQCTDSDVGTSRAVKECHLLSSPATPNPAGNKRDSPQDGFDLDCSPHKTASRNSLRPKENAVVPTVPPYRQLSARFDEYLKSTALFDQDYYAQTMEALQAIRLQHCDMVNSDKPATSPNSAPMEVSSQNDRCESISPAAALFSTEALSKKYPGLTSAAEDQSELRNSLTDPKSLLQLNDEAMLAKVECFGVQADWFMATKVAEREQLAAAFMPAVIMDQAKENDVDTVIEWKGCDDTSSESATLTDEEAADISSYASAGIFHASDTISYPCESKGKFKGHAPHLAGFTRLPWDAGYLLHQLKKPKVGTPSPLSEKLLPRKMF